jgi:hypothetical protein
MIPSVFSGTLYFDDGSSDRITVNRLIIREKDISFSLLATWNGMTTIIELDGAAAKNGNRFESKELSPKPIDAGFYPVTLEITEIENFEEGIFIAGIWKTKTSQIPFSGELDFFKAP